MEAWRVGVVIVGGVAVVVVIVLVVVVPVLVALLGEQIKQHANVFKFAYYLDIYLYYCSGNAG